MLRKRLAITVATAPLLALAHGAYADTTITGATSTPVATSTANKGAPDNIVVATGGAITVTAPTPIITLDSDNTVTLGGSLVSTDVNNTTGILVTPGKTGAVVLDTTGVISLTETAADADGDSDGDFDTPYAVGSGRTGIAVQGAFTGAIDLKSGSKVGVVGNDSDGVVLSGPLTGSLTSGAIITTSGDRSVGVRVSGPVSGDVKIGGAVVSRGVDSQAVAISGDVAGQVNLSGELSSTGYRSITRPDEDIVAKLDANDLYANKTAVTIAGNVAQGIMVSLRPTGSDADPDVDDDGVLDKNQTNGSVTSYGPGPALVVGSDTRDITVGKVTTGGAGYGLILNGQVSGLGIYDNFSATGLQIGGSAGKAATIDGGVLNTSTISALTSKGAATAIELKSGAVVDRFVNTGSVNASVIGDAAEAVGLRDLSGSLTTIDNTGSIRAAITVADGKATGQTIALDLAAAKAGLSLNQTQSSVENAAAPRIIGDVRLGGFADTVNLQAGTLTGALSFGSGADNFTLGGGSIFKGALSDSDGALSLNIGKAELQMTNTSGVVSATSLDIGAEGTLIFTADPNLNSVGSLNVATANLASGASVGITVNDYLSKDATFTVLTTNGLTAPSVKNVAAADAPYLFVSDAKVNGNNLDVAIRRRTAEELGFTESEAATYDGVYAALRANSATAFGKSILAANNETDLLRRYEQLLPDQGDVLFGALEGANLGMAQAVSQRPDPKTRFGPDSLWFREVNLRTERERGDTIGGESEAFGFIAGYEAMGFGRGDGGALGLTLSYMNAEAKDAAAQIGERTTVNMVSAGAYWRGQSGGLIYSVGGQAGYGRFTGVRRYLSPIETLDFTSRSKWDGSSISAFGSLAYETRIDRYFIRPSLDAAYLRISEDGHQDAGGGAGFDLKVERRTNSRAVAQAMLALGAEFGSGFWWRPELQLGYRARGGGEVGRTTAQFTTGGGPAFTMPAISDEGAPVIGVAFRAGSALSYMAIEAEAELADSETRYQLNLQGRVMF